MKRFYPALMIALWLAAVVFFATTGYGASLIVKDGQGNLQNLNEQTNPSGQLSPRTLVCDAADPDNCANTAAIGNGSSPLGLLVVPVQTVASQLNMTAQQSTASALQMTAFQSNGANFHITCDAGCSVGTLGFVDAATFTPGTTPGILAGGFYQTTPTNNQLANLQGGSVQLTSTRAVFTNLRNNAGTEVGTSSTPMQVSIANTAANATPIVDTATLNQAGSALSNTNGIWANILTGNAAVANGNPLYVALSPSMSGGLSIQSAIVANNTTSVAVGTSAGHQLYGIDGFSIATTNPVYVKLYNTAQGSTTCGSGTPVARYMIPASGGASGSGEIMHDANGIAFSTALTYCVTAGIGDADTTSPSANTYILNMIYK